MITKSYEAVLLGNDKQKEILHHRWLVFGIIVAIIITLLGLWEFLLMITEGFLFIYLFFWCFYRIGDWLSGEGMRNPSNNEVHDEPNESDHDSVSDTLWDIETLHALQHHDDDYTHYRDYLNDDGDKDNDDDWN